MIYLRQLTSDDAPAVGRIEAAVHPRALVDGVERHQRYLREATDEGVNLSFGVFDDDRLVGYVLCYGFEPTARPDRTGDVVYLEDLAVLPEYRAVVPRLLRRMFGDAREYFPDAAVEAHALQSILPWWRKHAAFFQRIGFTMMPHTTTDDTVDGEPRHHLRWEPVPDAARLEVGRLLAKLPGETVRVDGEGEYVFKVVRDERDWGALEPVWDKLLLATAEHTVFQSFAYQRLWWRHFGGDAELFIVLVVRDNVVAGIAPLQRRPVKRFGRYCRKLGFIGSRWQVDRPTFLFPRHASAMRRAFVQFLAQRTNEWDICELYEQPVDHPGAQQLQADFRAAGHLVASSPDSACPYLAIGGTWSEFLAGKSSTFRKNLKTAGRRLRERGDLQYRTYTVPSEVMEQLEIYRNLEARSWKSERGVGVARDADYFAFHRELAEVFARDGAFVIRMLTVDGKAVAGTFGFEYDGVFSSLQIVHDRDYARCSPGTYLEALEMEECFGRGNREYEFLGGFLNNKSRWTSTFRHTVQLHFYRRTPLLTAWYVIMHRIKPWVKERIRPYMKSWRQKTPVPTTEPSTDGD